MKKRILSSLAGEGNMGCIMIIACIVIGGYVGYQFLIPYVEYSNFEGQIAEMMPYYKFHEADYIRQTVIDTAKTDFGIALEPEQVKVTVDKKANHVTIDIEYNKDVVFPYYTYTYVFRPHLTGQAY